ncbi:MAG: hypothetical protein K9K65_10605 [Desulfarculaceae bacterium]|nr:hypothetical protein [Desulfarculaceae bacterium]MCF8047134.1 hypothetical protein [Desulfarculaceae bacterium]MCF8063765.1 hypothetical protein [Desulfarculaceae bacterium]MCF8098282.1 hypothetical protein [Desulfarculaceae bacterium]
MTGDTKPQATSGEVRTPLLQISRSRVDDVKNTMGLAITKTGVAGVKARHRPQLLSDHGPCYLAGHLKVMTQSISFDQYSS